MTMGTTWFLHIANFVDDLMILLIEFDAYVVLNIYDPSRDSDTRMTLPKAFNITIVQIKIASRGGKEYLKKRFLQSKNQV